MDESTARARLRRRDDEADVVSDARISDFETLNSAFDPPDELPGPSTRLIKCTGATGRAASAALISLAGASPYRSLHRAM